MKFPAHSLNGKIGPVLLLTCSVVTVSCGPAAGEKQASLVDATPLTRGELRNASYSGIGQEPVQLADGSWHGKPFVEGGSAAPAVGLVDDFSLEGDLDGDGAMETVVLLWSSSGGSGVFDYVAVMERAADGSVRNAGTAALGDRVKLMSGSVAGRQLVLEVLEAGPGDAACCPGLKKRRVFAMENGKLVEREGEELGRLSLSDLEGSWRLVSFSRGEAVAGDLELALLVEGNRISGKAACNRYNGSVEEGKSPGEIRSGGPLATTRMMCPPAQMEAERRYLRGLENLTAYTFLAGRLALSWNDEEQAGLFLFDRLP